MKILLIRPPRIKQAITLSDFMYSEPIGLEILFSLLKERHDVEIFDMMCDDQPLLIKLEAFNPDVTGITSLCIDVLEVLRITEKIKAWNPLIATIVGGTQAFLNPQAFFHPSVDHIFRFTTRENIHQFFDAPSKDENIPGILSRSNGYQGEEVQGKNEYCVPDRTSTAKYRQHYSYFGYKPAAIMQISQGCAKACRFCLRWRIEGFKEIEFDDQLIEEDLLHIQEDTIMLFDNDILGSVERVEGLIELLEKHHIRKNFIAYASVEGILKNVETLKRFQQYGLKALLVGYESFSDQEMAYYTKKTKADDNLKAAKILKALDIDVWASFMAHPDWDRNDFTQFRRFVKALSPQVSSVSPLTPFMGLPLYREYEDRLLYRVDDYEKWSFAQVMIKPGKMSLKAYYHQMLLTNLYINLFLNQPTKMIKRYGIKNMMRLILGSMSAFGKYLRLMRQARQDIKTQGK